MQSTQLNLDSFEGTINQIINDNDENTTVAKHNDGTEIFYYKNGLINKWNPKNDNLVILNVTNKKYDIITKIDANLKKSLQKYNWTTLKTNKSNNVYIRTNHNQHIYLHEYVLHLNGIEKPDDGKTYSVDHINRDTLDNRLENLRWATQSEQNQNKDKNARKYNARALPEGIEEKDIPKFVTYNEEIYDKEKGTKRNFFRIEKHPSGMKWASTKSNKVSIQDKLAETYNKLIELGDKIDNIPEYVKISTRNPDILAEEDGFTLRKSMMPKYVNFVRETEKRGCKFEIAIPDEKRVSTSGSKRVSLEKKYEEMKNKLNELSK